MLRSALQHKKYFFSALAISVLLLTIFTTVLYNQYRLSQEQNGLMVQSYEVLRQGRLVLTYILDVETGQRGYLLTGSTKFLEPYNQAIGKLDASIDKVIDLVADNPTQQVKAMAYKVKIEEFKESLAQQMIKFGKGGVRAIRVRDLQISKIKMDELRAAHVDFMRAEMNLLRFRSAKAAKKQKKYIMTLIVGSVVAIGGMIISELLVWQLTARNRRTEEKLRATEQRYSLVMNGINDGLYDYNMLSGAVYYSPSYKEMLGYSDKEFPNKIENFYASLHQDDHETARQFFDKFKEGKQVSDTALFRLRHRNGSWRWVMARAVGIWNKAGRLERLIGTHTDITEHKEREEELKRVNADLESFTNLASHDLRAPLVNLKGFANEVEFAHKQIDPLISKVLTHLPDAEQEKVRDALQKDIPESLGFMRTAVERMDALTKAILDLSRVGVKIYRFEDIDTNKLVKTCLESLAHDISKQKVEIVCDPLPNLYTDRLSLEQIFSNILDNSIKYMDPARPGKIHISAQEFPRSIFICVRDNGRGIAKSEQDAVFNAFRRAVNTAGVRGAGMGMPYVQAILRKLGGRIWFDSKLGEGSAFYFSIPKEAETKDRLNANYKAAA